jgi:hypothetical protein
MVVCRDPFECSLVVHDGHRASDVPRVAASDPGNLARASPGRATFRLAAASREP